MVLRKNANEEIRVENLSWSQPDLNQRPSDYESPALTTELWGDLKSGWNYREKPSSRLEAEDYSVNY